MIVVVIVLGGFLLIPILLIVMAWPKRIKRTRRVIDGFSRIQELEQSMDILLGKHSVVNSIDELFMLITLYANCRNVTESNFCKDYLRRKAKTAYNRYDEERLH